VDRHAAPYSLKPRVIRLARVPACAAR